MGDVVNFGGLRGRQPNRDARQQAASVRSHDDRAERAAELRKRLKVNRPMSWEDRTIIARGVWRWLDRLQSSGTATKAQTLRKAGIGSESDSTKHLGQYAFNPAHSNGGAGRLNKKPQKYVAILDAVAELSGTDRDIVLLDVFDATSLSASGVVRMAEPEFEELAARLRLIADAVAAKHGLQHYFKRVLRSGVCLKVSNEGEQTKAKPFEPDDIELESQDSFEPLDWPVILRRPCDDFQRHDGWGEVPLYPTLVLGRWDVGDECRFWHKEACDDDEDCSSSSSETVVRGQYSAEFRFCIVPSGPDLHPEAALRVVIGVRCSSPLSDPPDYEYVGPDFIVRGRVLSTSGILVGSRGEKNYMLRAESLELPDPMSRYFTSSNESQVDGCIFLPLTGIVAQDWFNLECGVHLSDYSVREQPLHVRTLGEALLNFPRNSCFSPFKMNTIASALDHCLTNNGQNNPLDLLDEHAGRLVRMFSNAELEECARRERELGRLDDRLRRMASQKPDVR